MLACVTFSVLVYHMHTSDTFFLLCHLYDNGQYFSVHVLVIKRTYNFRIQSESKKISEYATESNNTGALIQSINALIISVSAAHTALFSKMMSSLMQAFIF